MKYFLIILIILAFVIGIFDLKFMLECKKEQKIIKQKHLSM